MEQVAGGDLRPVPRVESRIVEDQVQDPSARGQVREPLVPDVDRVHGHGTGEMRSVGRGGHHHSPLAAGRALAPGHVHAEPVGSDGRVGVEPRVRVETGAGGRPVPALPAAEGRRGERLERGHVRGVPEGLAAVGGGRHPQVLLASERHVHRAVRADGDVGEGSADRRRRRLGDVRERGAVVRGSRERDRRTPGHDVAPRDVDAARERAPRRVGGDGRLVLEVLLVAREHQGPAGVAAPVGPVASHQDGVAERGRTVLEGPEAQEGVVEATSGVEGLGGVTGFGAVPSPGEPSPRPAGVARIAGGQAGAPGPSGVGGTVEAGPHRGPGHRGAGLVGPGHHDVGIARIDRDRGLVLEEPRGAAGQRGRIGQPVRPDVGAGEVVRRHPVVGEPGHRGAAGQQQSGTRHAQTEGQGPPRDQRPGPMKGRLGEEPPPS